MSEASERRVLRGIGASPGVALAPARVLRQGTRMVMRRTVPPPGLDAEVARLREAIEASRLEIDAVRESLAAEHGADYALVLDAHLLMHRDELLVDGAIERIRRDGINAEWALRVTVDALKAPLLAAESTYFRERASDLEHVGQHILRHLAGGADGLPELDEPVILVAADISPADAARIVGSGVLGLVTSVGSATSHTAILARALDVPAVVGARAAMVQIANDDVVIVDGLRGEVVVHADAEEQARALERGQRFRSFTGALLEHRDEPTTTRDDVFVHLLANLELPAEASVAVERGAAGIGLYRTEFLYLDRAFPPSEDEQARIYAQVLRAVAPRPVTFRTCDLGGDKVPGSMTRLPGANPALGQRAIRLSLARPDLFKQQVRAILRASVHGTAKLMFPLISGLDELREARALVESCVTELAAEGVEHVAIPLGTMIEVPSAALMADLLAAECDFFSVGTNDLVQYTLALDRGNPDVAARAQPLDPSVLRLLDMTGRAARQAGIGLSICGDMAADPLALPIAIGLGYRELSVPLAAIPLAREAIRRIDAAMVTGLAADAIRCATAQEVRRLVLAALADDLGELWREQGIGD